MGGVTGTAFATDTQVKQAIDALYQRREVQVARFEASAYASKVQPTEADLKAYYDAHTSQFQQSRSEEHTSELQSQSNLVCRLLLEKKKTIKTHRLHSKTV